jgi:hypothetical protein
MKTEQKTEMTKEEFAKKWGKIPNTLEKRAYVDETEYCLFNLRSVIRGELIREADELKKQNPYPESVFIPVSDETLKKVADYLKRGGYSPDALFGHWGRTVWNNCVERLKKKNNQ